MSQSAQNLKELSPQKSWGEFPSAVRVRGHRTQHGSTAWTSAGADLMQPQDQDSVADAGRVAGIGLRAKLAVIGSVIVSGEPEDARLTGSTRSLVRRMMGLNIAGREARKASLTETKIVA